MLIVLILTYMKLKTHYKNPDVVNSFLNCCVFRVIHTKFKRLFAQWLQAAIRYRKSDISELSVWHFSKVLKLTIYGKLEEHRLRRTFLIRFDKRVCTFLKTYISSDTSLVIIYILFYDGMWICIRKKIYRNID